MYASIHPHINLFLYLCFMDQVTKATGIFVPLAAHLIPVLQAAQFEKKTQHLIKGICDDVVCVYIL